ncbi:hypothetical protein [Desulfogranum mediterraneum]|uniref:hypothetical protein n=1 Tax=Desulfogranum mediterraneum TaxID=160661 RepID=UPI00042A7272|nr:hypothetical protein [Desulfogranum mediterraneum]
MNEEKGESPLLMRWEIRTDPIKICLARFPAEAVDKVRGQGNKILKGDGREAGLP